MDLGQLSTIVGLLAALSVAAERLVEIIKNIVPFLREEHKEAGKESYRKIALIVLAGVAGVFTAFLARPAIEGIVPGAWSSFWGLLALGLLASGGSGFWNSIVGYVGNIKDLKKQEEKHVEAEKLEIKDRIQDPALKNQIRD